MQPVDTLVIGAGQAGLAAGYHLQRAGQSFTILEAAAEPSGSWPQYYDSLRLLSPPLKGWAAGRRLLHGSNCCPARQSPA